MKNLILLLAVFLCSGIAYCAGPMPFNGLPQPQTISLADFLSQVTDTITALGGMSTMMKISAIIVLVIASMKVSGLSSLWAKLGEAQVWVAPILGLIAGVLGLGAGGVPVTWKLIAAYVLAGGGAVFLHEILDSVKAIPGLGPVYVKAIELAEKALGGAQVPTMAPAASDDKKAAS
jgi:hypothetical protein